MLEVTRKRCKICSELTPKTPGQRYLYQPNLFIASFEHISHSVSIVDLEQVNV